MKKAFPCIEERLSLMLRRRFLIFTSVALVNEVQPHSYLSYLSLRTSKAYTALFGGVKRDSSDRLFRVILAVGLVVSGCFHWYYYRLSGYKEKGLSDKAKTFCGAYETRTCFCNTLYHNYFYHSLSSM